MGWVWIDDNDDNAHQISPRDVTGFGKSEDRGSTRRVVKTLCRTEEVEPGRFVKKCEKTEEILRGCIGKSVQVIHSNKEFTEEDVTDAVQRGGSFMYGSSGLQNDIEAFERNLFGSLSRICEAAEEISKGLSDVFARAPRIFDGGSSSMRRGFPIEELPRREASSKSQPKDYGIIDDSCWKSAELI